MRYTTKTDAIEQAILPALGEYAADHDIDAIFDEAFAYRIDTNDRGQELLDSAGYEQTVDTDDFWAIVAKHATA